MRPLVSRAKSQDPPPWVVFEALTEPNRQPSRQWLQLADGEVAPRILAATHPNKVVWSSLWPERPRDEIHFDVEGFDGPGTHLRWTLLSPDDEPSPERLRELRHRINFLINGELRAAFDQ